MEDDDNDCCLLCGTAEGDSSNLTSQSSLQTNATVGCGHQFCKSCTDRELSSRKEFPCPRCGIAVKKVTLSTRSLDEIMVKNDTDCRRRVTKIFNKVEKDFETLFKYNNYLEEVEDIIYSIVNEKPNAEEMKTKVKKEEEVNKKQIVVRQSRRTDEERSIADRIAIEQREAEQLKQDFKDEERQIALKKRQFKQELAEVHLGDREEVSAELKAAQMAGYRNELRNRRNNTGANNTIQPRVREPECGLQRDKNDRELKMKRQAAGSGIPTGGNIATKERNWTETVSSLFPVNAS